MAKQDWSPRMVWVVGYDNKDGFSVEVFQEEKDAQRAAAASVLETIKDHAREDFPEAKKHFDRKEYQDVLQLHEDLISEYAYADEYVMIWHEKIQ